MGVAALSILVLAVEASPVPIPGFGASGISERISQLRQALSNSDFEPTSELRDEIRSVAFRAPLDALPFYAAALELDETRDADRIIALLDQTLQRNPRHTYARTWRARMYFRTQQPQRAAAEIALLLGVDPAREAFYVDALVDLARDHEGQSALLDLLSRSPRWARAFALRAVSTLDDNEFLAAMAQNSKVAFDVYVGELARAGDLEHAFLIWQSRLTTDELLRFSWPFDRRFDQASEAGVFGWSIAPALAQRSRSGLQVFYSGLGAPQIASQTLLLGPGYDYRLQVTATAEVEDDGGRFALALLCRPSGTLLGEIVIATSEQAPKLSSRDIAIPHEGCAQQSLQLAGRAGERGLRARATVHEVSILEIGPSSAKTMPAGEPPAASKSTP